MANTKLPPTPVGVPPGHSFWNDWYERLRNIVNSTLVNHNDLQSIQGGSASERYHLTFGQQSSLTGGGDSTQHFHSSDRARANHTGTQTLATIGDVTITAANLNSLDDGVDSTLHFHASDRARANHTGTQTMATISDLPTLAHGTYTPTLTNTANLDASTAYACQYLRVGNTVTVSGKVDVDPTTTTTLTTLGISLPIASNFATAQQLGGTAATTSDITEAAAGIFADTTNDRATMQWRTTDVTNHDMFFSFTYLIV